MDDDLTQNGERPHQKWKTIKMEDDQIEIRQNWKTTIMENDQNGRRLKLDIMEDIQDRTRV